MRKYFGFPSVLPALISGLVYVTPFALEAQQRSSWPSEVFIFKDAPASNTYTRSKAAVQRKMNEVVRNSRQKYDQRIPAYDRRHVIKMADTLQTRVQACGSWPEDIGRSISNDTYFNFGCAMQNNLAAIVANPEDLRGGRTPRSRGDLLSTRSALENYIKGNSPSRDWSIGENAANTTNIIE